MKRPSQRLRPTYRLWWHDGKTWMSYLRHTTSSKSNINHFIINHCSDPHLQNVHNIFFLRNHWIAFLIQRKLEKILILDSLDWSTQTYQEFLNILQLWVNFLSSLCISYLKITEMTLRTKFLCHKQPACSVYYGYYMCENMRQQGRYITYPERVRGYSLLGLYACLHYFLTVTSTCLILPWTP